MPLAEDMLAQLHSGEIRRLADSLLPHVVEALAERLRSRIPDEARAMAEVAAGTPGLDEVSLAALADWLEERGLDADGAKVRALALRDGDLLVIQPDRPMTQQNMQYLRDSASAFQGDLISRGRSINFLVLPHGLSMTHLRRGREGNESPPAGG